VVSPFQGVVDYERINKIPLGYINYSISRTSPNGTWHKLERGEIKIDADYFRNFKADLENEQRWQEYHDKLRREAKTAAVAGAQPLTASQLPPLPTIDVEKLFWSMMTESRHPDPHMFPALRKLKACGKFTLAALSNTVIFPPGSPVGEVAEGDVRRIFNVFVSSAHIGMRKPDPRIYEYTMEKLREQVGPDLRAEEVLFLDDIGENLKPAKVLGMRTIRVRLGKTDLAVRELETILHMNLLENAHEKARL
jgi:FMN phosphatase YigB (HAD superfamily)